MISLAEFLNREQNWEVPLDERYRKRKDIEKEDYFRARDQAEKTRYLYSGFTEEKVFYLLIQSRMLLKWLQ